MQTSVKRSQGFYKALASFNETYEGEISITEDEFQLARELIQTSRNETNRYHSNERNHLKLTPEQVELADEIFIAAFYGNESRFGGLRARYLELVPAELRRMFAVASGGAIFLLIDFSEFRPIWEGANAAVHRAGWRAVQEIKDQSMLSAIICNKKNLDGVELPHLTDVGRRMIYSRSPSVTWEDRDNFPKEFLLTVATEPNHLVFHEPTSEELMRVVRGPNYNGANYTFDIFYEMPSLREDHHLIFWMLVKFIAKRNGTQRSLTTPRYMFGSTGRKKDIPSSLHTIALMMDGVREIDRFVFDKPVCDWRTSLLGQMIPAITWYDV